MHILDRDIRLIEVSEGQLQGEISASWSVNNIPFGGYAAAILIQAMLQNSRKKKACIFTASYLAPCIIGHASIPVEGLSRGKQFDRYQARLIQDGNERIRSIGTFTDDKAATPFSRQESNPPQVANRNECVSFPTRPNYSIFDQMDIKMDPACAGWLTDRLSEKSELKGWVKFKADRHFDAPAIVLIADSFPPAVMASQGMSRWVPTVEYSVNIRGFPQTRWLKCIFRTRFITAGLLEEDGEVWDENDGLVALSRQIAHFRPNNR